MSRNELPLRDFDIAGTTEDYWVEALYDNPDRERVGEGMDIADAFALAVARSLWATKLDRPPRESTFVVFKEGSSEGAVVDVKTVSTHMLSIIARVAQAPISEVAPLEMEW